MNKKLLFFFISILPFFGYGCAHKSSAIRPEMQTAIDATLQSWRGMPEVNLVSQIGAPDRRKQAGDKMIYEYRTCDTKNELGVHRSKKGVDCYKWTFIIKDGRVADDSFGPWTVK